MQYLAHVTLTTLRGTFLVAACNLSNCGLKLTQAGHLRFSWELIYELHCAVIIIKCDAEDEELQQPWCKELDEHIGILAEDPGEGKVHLALVYTGFTTDCILRAFQISSIALVKLWAPPQLAHSVDRWNRRSKSEDLFAIFSSHCLFHSSPLWTQMFSSSCCYLFPIRAHLWCHSQSISSSPVLQSLTWTRGREGFSLRKP